MYIQLTLYWFLNLHWRSKSQGQNSPWVVRFIPIAPKDATKQRKKGRKDDWTNERTNKASGFSCGRSSERTWSFPRDIKAVHLLLPFPPHFTIPPLNPEQHQLTICSILRSIDFLHTNTKGTAEEMIRFLSHPPPKHTTQTTVLPLWLSCPPPPPYLGICSAISSRLSDGFMGVRSNSRDGASVRWVS